MGSVEQGSVLVVEEHVATPLVLWISNKKVLAEAAGVVFSGTFLYAGL